MHTCPFFWLFCFVYITATCTTCICKPSLFYYKIQELNLKSIIWTNVQEIGYGMKGMKCTLLWKCGVHVVIKLSNRYMLTWTTRIHFHITNTYTGYVLHTYEFLFCIFSPWPQFSDLTKMSGFKRIASTKGHFVDLDSGVIREEGLDGVTNPLPSRNFCSLGRKILFRIFVMK